MRYDKGEQLTVGDLKKLLSFLPDRIKIRVGLGDVTAPLHYLLNHGGQLLLHTDCYGADSSTTNFITIAELSKDKT